MKKKIALALALAASCVALATATGATATPGSPASGTQEFTATFDERLAGPNLVIRLHLEGTWFGTFAGSVTGDVMEVVRATGDSRPHGFTTCVCTVEGRSGTVTFVSVIAASLDPVTFEFHLQGRLVAVQATGELAGLHAVIDVVLDSATFITTYSGSYHFD